MLDGLKLSIDAMGGDDAPDIVIKGLEHYLKTGGIGHKARFLLHGHEDKLTPLLAKAPLLSARSEIHHTEKAFTMDTKPAQAMRRGKGSSMWNAVESVKNGEAEVVLSAGNTGALMAVSKLILRMKSGVERPAIAGLWPRAKGNNGVVLDIGANIECDANQLTEFAVLGAAYHRALYGSDNPTVGLLNVGTEDQKGHASIQLAHDRLTNNAINLNYIGFIEGNDISTGNADVVVTDGFTGNVALKTAEGTARLVGGFVKEALTDGVLGKLSALLNYKSLKRLKDRMDPRKVNGGVFLGLNGVVIKSHGGTDAIGFANAVQVAVTMAESHFNAEIERALAVLHRDDETMEASKA